MVDFRLFSDRLFRSASAVLALGSAAFIGTLFLVALFFQDGLGLSALQSGLNTFPEAIGVMAGSQVVTRLLYPAFGPRRIMVGGLVLLAVAHEPPGPGRHRDQPLVGPGGHVRVGLRHGPRLRAVAGRRLRHHLAGRHRAGVDPLQRPAPGRSAGGVALLTTVVATVGPVHEVAGQSVPNLAAYHAAFLVAASTALIAALCALTVSDADAAATIVPRRAAATGRRPSIATRCSRCRRPGPEPHSEPRPSGAPGRGPALRRSAPGDGSSAPVAAAGAHRLAWAV